MEKIKYKGNEGVFYSEKEFRKLQSKVIAQRRLNKKLKGAIE